MIPNLRNAIPINIRMNASISDLLKKYLGLMLLLAVPAVSTASDFLYLWQDSGIETRSGRPSINVMLKDDGKVHPAVLVIPGGAYHSVSKSEGVPIAEKFRELGYHTFVLDYRTHPSRFPEPQLDAMRAMKLIRANAEKWKIAPDQVYVCGFSAGGHLAGSLGILCDDLDASAGDEADKFSHIPDGMILCYGVLSFAPWSHRNSPRWLFGDGFENICENYSLPEKVTEKTPPAFIIHTVKDKLVPCRNSTDFAEAMNKAGVPYELMLYYSGGHGSLSLDSRMRSLRWHEQADRFFQSLHPQRPDVK